MNSRLAIVALMLLAASCKKKEAAPRADELPVKSVVNGMNMLEYQYPGGLFQADAPATWKLREDNDLGPSATFIGPGSGARPFSVNIHISRYPNSVDKSGDPKHYYKGFSLFEKIVLPFESRKVGGREVETYAIERPFRKMHSQKVEYQRRVETAIIRIADGFWVVEHSAPVEDYKATYPIFEAVVASFKPGPVPLPK